MNDDHSTFAAGPDPAPDPETGGSGAAVELPVDLPLDYEAYALGHRKAFLVFAEEMLGDKTAAERIVHEVMVRIAIDCGASCARRTSRTAPGTCSPPRSSARPTAAGATPSSPPGSTAPRPCSPTCARA
ncbi:hypothetical protein GCM10010441_18000 [Kitasatospora paracochleata]